MSAENDANSAVLADELIGKTIGGKYQLLSLLGKGGMSAVYKASQLPINRVVAVKMLLSHLSSDENSIKRFLQEAQAAGQIVHPNIVTIFDFGFTENQQAYLVMDYLEGETLADYLKRKGRIPFKRAIPIFMEICDALDEAHRHNVVHRDLKPSNIVLQDLPDFGKRPRIVDFGIAKVLDAESQHLTKTGDVFGSPLYMSPEQCEGRSLDSRSDIYSLGVVFYEVLSGQLPLAGQSALETMRLHLNEIPPSLQKVSGPQFPIPLALENLIFKMMAKDREKRPLTMAAVKLELQQILAGESNQLSGNITHMKREFSRKSKTVAIAAGTLLFALSLSVFAYPGVCSQLAQMQLANGVKLYSSGKMSEAEASLLSSLDWSQRAGSKSGESRSLGVLLKVYESEHKDSEASQVRRRRRELIKEE
ncbi:MAG: serine/threonine protein kinase, partial [Candidatus Obscuribacterales bacterium]|nr:serine/threonine protein kinase [Candidatus Obscuribacterales bacterium]